MVLVSSCERLRTAPLRALSPTGLFTAMEVSPGNGREQRARHGESSKERLKDGSNDDRTGHAVVRGARFVAVRQTFVLCGQAAPCASRAAPSAPASLLPAP